MKEVKAIIQPFMLSPVLSALRDIADLPALTVSQVEGFGTVDPELAPHVKTKLEVMVPDELVQAVIETIQRSAYTGNRGDGRVFVIPVEASVKIRTGETGTAT